MKYKRTLWRYLYRRNQRVTEGYTILRRKLKIYQTFFRIFLKYKPRLSVRILNNRKLMRTYVHNSQKKRTICQFGTESPVDAVKRVCVRN
jgi:hypothetical protein